MSRPSVTIAGLTERLFGDEAFSDRDAAALELRKDFNAARGLVLSGAADFKTWLHNWLQEPARELRARLRATHPQLSWYLDGVEARLALKDFKNLTSKEDRRTALWAVFRWVTVIRNQDAAEVDLFFHQRLGEEEGDTDVIESEARKVFFSGKRLHPIFGMPEAHDLVHWAYRWFLRRHDLRSAYRIARSSPAWWTVLNLLLPRNLAAITLGVIALQFNDDGWRILERLQRPEMRWGYVVIAVLATMISLIYLVCEVSHKVTRKPQRRAFAVIAIAYPQAIVVSLLVYLAFGRGVAEGANAPGLRMGWDAPWDFLAFFPSVSILLGILFQTLWEDKNVTEPL